jgi:hypothetical protein
MQSSRSSNSHRFGVIAPDVHDVAAEVEQVVLDAGQLGEEHPQVLRADRHLEVSSFSIART